MKLKGSIALSVLSLAACGDAGEGAGKKFEIGVAPLQLDTITEACYRLTVYNEDLAYAQSESFDELDSGDTYISDSRVWDLDDVCAGQYGDLSGSITYIGTCDADGDENDVDFDPTTRQNTVRLILNDLWDNAGDHNETTALTSPDDYANPCPEDDPCFLEETCEENADQLVEFNLTILRNAKQGFFDIAVNFSDVFCSGKFDCNAGNLLFDDTGNRATTSVLGFACTSGEEGPTDSNDTFMYMDDITLKCDDDDNETNGVVNIIDINTDPGVDGPGNQLDAMPSTGSGNYPVFQYAIYTDSEFDSSTTINKDFWNIAIGFNTEALEGLGATYSHCWIETRGTASDTELSNGATDPDEVYPIVHWKVDVMTDGDALTCDEIAIGDPGVDIEYTKLQTDDEEWFDNWGYEDFDGNFNVSQVPRF